MTATGAGRALAPGWQQSLDGLVLTPERYEDERVGWTAACRILRCDNAILESLVSRGLRFHESAGEATFGFCDVMNVGLYSSSGRSVPELAESYIMRFAASDPARWTDTRRWKVTVDLRCHRGIACMGERWRIPRPDTERFGGSASAWRTCTTDSVRTAGLMRAEVDAVTCGQIMEVASGAAREIYHEAFGNLVSGRWRYQYMPLALRTDPEAAAANGTMDCMSTGLWLERRCKELGLEARTRKGHILGITGVEHVWLEVRDEPLEGRDEPGPWKVLDPVLAALAIRAVGTTGQRFAEFSLGSMSNRILPWPRDAAEAIFGHLCAHGDMPRRMAATVSAVPADGDAPVGLRSES